LTGCGKPEPFYRIRTNEVMIGFNTDVGIVEKFTENETQKKIISLMLVNPRIPRTAIAEQVGITVRGVQKNIDELKKAGIIKRVGAAKGGHWVVTNR
jgi:ATP-dependent DNA helicase RecG